MKALTAKVELPGRAVNKISSHCCVTDYTFAGVVGSARVVSYGRPM